MLDDGVLVVLLTRSRIKYCDVGYICGYWNLSRIYNFSTLIARNLPTLEGVVEVLISLGSRRIRIRRLVVVNLSRADNLAVIVQPSYGVLVDLEHSVKADVTLRHGERRRAVVVNSYVYVVSRPALKGIAFLRGSRRTYGYRSINLYTALRRNLLVVNIVLYVVRSLNPFCIQMQVAHQRSRFVYLGAVDILVPAVEGIALTLGQIGSAIGGECLIFIAGGGGVNVGSVITKVGMVGDINGYALQVTVNMVTVNLMLNGIPYDLETGAVEALAEQSISGGTIGIGLQSIIAIRIPVFLSEETEIRRYIQIVLVNAVCDVGNRIAEVTDAILAGFGQKTFVAGIRTQTPYATIAARGTGSLVITARQVIFLTLVLVVLRRTALRQKHEILGFLPPILWEADLKRLRADFIFRRIAYYIIILRIVFRIFRNVGRSVVIARLRAVRTAVCFVVRRSRCGILILGRLCLGLRRSGISGSFGGVCCGSGIIHRHCDFFVRRKKCDVLIVGQRPARAHGQHHDSRKSSCEQTFARILF